MAIALVGGMLVSTALTLFVMPAAYSVLDDVVSWNDERRQHGHGFFAELGGLWARIRPANGRTPV